MSRIYCIGELLLVHIATIRRLTELIDAVLMGRAHRTSIKLPDMPKYADVSHLELQLHIENRKERKCQGYVDRMLEYEARTGLKICPI